MLTRARPVAGDAALCRRITETLEAVLRSARDPRRLVIDVADMRRRIAEENPHPSPWDLKNRRGGLIDLEFVVQYLILREAAAFPQILRRGTAQALRAIGEAGLLPRHAARELGEAVTLLRDVQAVLTLLGDGLPPSAALPAPAPWRHPAPSVPPPPSPRDPASCAHAVRQPALRSPWARAGSRRFR